LVVLTKATTPESVRRIGISHLARWLKDRGVRRAHELAEEVVAAAKAQRHRLPASEAKGALVSEMAAEVLRARNRIASVDARLEELLSARPEAEVVRSLPGMGLVFVAEFLSEVGTLSRFDSGDSLAAAAGLVPIRRASGNTSFQRRAKRGNRVLKRLMYWSAFRSITFHRSSRAFYDRKRAEGKAHHQAVIALARRRANVLWAMLRDGQPYRERLPEEAA
jgi:transposase